MNYLDMLVIAQVRGWRFRRKCDGGIFWYDRGNLLHNGDVAECDYSTIHGRYHAIRYTAEKATRFTLPVC